MQRQVAIRAMGSISAFGASSSEVKHAYTLGRSALATRHVGAEHWPCGALPDEAERSLQQFLGERGRYRDLDRTVKLAAYAARQAMNGAGWRDASDRRLGVAVGSSRGATELLEERHSEFLERRAVRATSSPVTSLGNIASWVAQEAGGMAVAACEVSSACSTAGCALSMAAAYLRSGMATHFLAGGSEAPLTAFTFAQMMALGIHSRSAAELPCRPCALERAEPNSMVLGEGAAILALEAVDERPAGEGLAWLSGLGSAVEPTTSKTSIRADGLGLKLAMTRALEDAGIDAPDVVITHTPGTLRGDSAEQTALEAVFGARMPCLTSNKWLIGHALGASGALSLEYAILLLQGLKPVPYPYPVALVGAAPPERVRHVLVNSSGFGGIAMSTVLTRWDEPPRRRRERG